MATSRLFINEKQVKKNGETPVYALVQLNNKTLKINTGVLVVPGNFDKTKNRIKGNTNEVKDQNLILDKCLGRINDIFVRYRLQGKHLTPDLFKREYENPGLFVDFYLFLDKQIKEREKGNEITTSSAKQHRVLLNKLKDFKSELSFSEIDSQFLTDFNRYLRRKLENDTNTANKNLSTFRTYLNIAKRAGIINTNPFDLYKMKKVQIERVFLTENELKALWELYTDGNQLPDAHTRTLRHFLFMSFTGLRISDFIRLEKNSVDDGFLRFVPYKTKNAKRNEIQVPLIDKAQQLIKEENSKTKLLFEAISEQKMNVQLKEIASAAKIKKNMTNHVARHTFATMFIEKTSDVATLQRLLGHSQITETMTYVHITSRKITDQMRNFEKLLKL